MGGSKKDVVHTIQGVSLDLVEAPCDAVDSEDIFRLAIRPAEDALTRRAADDSAVRARRADMVGRSGGRGQRCSVRLVVNFEHGSDRRA